MPNNHGTKLTAIAVYVPDEIAAAFKLAAENSGFSTMSGAMRKLVYEFITDKKKRAI